MVKNHNYGKDNKPNSSYTAKLKVKQLFVDYTVLKDLLNATFILGNNHGTICIDLTKELVIQRIL